MLSIAKQDYYKWLSHHGYCLTLHELSPVPFLAHLSSCWKTSPSSTSASASGSIHRTPHQSDTLQRQRDKHHHSSLPRCLNCCLRFLYDIFICMFFFFFHHSHWGQHHWVLPDHSMKKVCLVQVHIPKGLRLQGLKHVKESYIHPGNPVHNYMQMYIQVKDLKCNLIYFKVSLTLHFCWCLLTVVLQEDVLTSTWIVLVIKATPPVFQ